MILNDVTVTYNDGITGTMCNVKYMDIDDSQLTLNCTHDVDIFIPLRNINIIRIERRLADVRTKDEEPKYKTQVL